MSCLVFDIDDTLYLERDYVLSGFTAVDRLLRNERGIIGFLPAALERSAAWSADAGRHCGHVIDDALAAIGVDPTPALVGPLVGTYRTHQPDIALLDDARRALDRATRATVAIVSDGPAVSQRAKCAALGLAAWAEPILLTAERCPGEGKPSTRPFEMVEQLCGTTPKHCAYVADNPLKDFRGPADRGWTTVRIRRPGSLHYRLDSDEDVDAEITSLADLWDVVSEAS